MKLDDALVGVDRLGLDTPPFNQRFLLRSRNFSLDLVTADIAEQAADLRARYGLRTPDALQVATALAAGCAALLTNDARLQRVTELRVLVLDEIEL